MLLTCAIVLPLYAAVTESIGTKRHEKQIQTQWKARALATQNGTDRSVAGLYLLVDGAARYIQPARSATDFNAALLVGRQHYCRVNPVTGRGFAPSHKDFCAIAPIDVKQSSQTYTWGWFVASDDSTLAAPAFIARVQGKQGVAPVSDWIALQDHDYCSPASPPVSPNTLAPLSASKAKECATNIAAGLGAFTHRDVAKQRSSNNAGGRGEYADGELQLSAAIAAASVRVVLRTMAGESLQLDWSGPWRLSATAAFAIDVRALAVEQHPAALGLYPEEFDLVPFGDGQDGDAGGAGAGDAKVGGLATSDGDGAGAGDAGGNGNDDVGGGGVEGGVGGGSAAGDGGGAAAAGNASGSGDAAGVVNAADVGVVGGTACTAGVTGDSFTTIDLDEAYKILRMAAGSELAYLALMRHQVPVTIAVQTQANDVAQPAGNDDASAPATTGDVGSTVSFIANHAEATVGYVRRKLVAHLRLDAALFTVKIQRQAKEEELWVDAAAMTYSQEPVRHLVVTPVLLSDSSIPARWRQETSHTPNKGCTIT